MQMVENQKHNKFNSLTPELLDENESIYTEALDYAFDNDDIKNIAITGIYGSGKSTVWNTYKSHRLQKNSCKKLGNNHFKNVITVSLGKYEDSEKVEFDKSDEYNEYNEIKEECDCCEADGDNKTEKKFENRVERQLINQIVSQIDSKKIPRSKYRFKNNIEPKILFMRVFMTVIFIASILLWILREPATIFLEEIIKKFNLESVIQSREMFIFILGIMFFLPIVLFLSRFYNENNIKLSKVNLKGAEANLNDENNDETFLDRDIKELVYLLNSSQSNIVVFEDLDRYDNIEIFTKLRELNFLLNSFIKSNGNSKDNGRVVKFVYLLKDGLFFSKDRTKFFDFIMPIVPIVDSKTSEDKLIELLESIDNTPDRKVVMDISLYVDDMRLLRNIVNEYIIYSKIIPLEKIDLDKNKLFTLITFKNIFPEEFEVLQKDKGIVVELFNKLEISRKKLKKKFEEELKEANERIEFLLNRIENNKYEAMALMIPASVKLNSDEKRAWSEVLKEWSKEEDNRYVEGSYLNYRMFCEKYVFRDKEKIELINKIPEDRGAEIKKIQSDVKRIERDIMVIDSYNYKDIISKMKPEEREDLFAIHGFEIVKSHNYPLIRFLISYGLLDKTYKYYKGHFDVDASNTLKRNDIVYRKGILEGKKLDIFLEVESPEEIINRMDSSEFISFNILNKKILETCLKKNFDKHVIAITDSVDIYDNYKDLIRVLNKYELNIVKKYVDILQKNNIEKLVNIMRVCSDIEEPTFKNMLICLFTNKSISSDKLNLFRTYIEPTENIISLIPEKQIDDFIEQISSTGIKFNNLEKSNCNKDRLIKIERIKAYKLNIRNMIFISKNILEKNIRYGDLLNEIYRAEQLDSSKEYIEDNFVDVISKYIEENTNKESYTNDEDLFIKILESNLSAKLKLEYVKSNETVITDLKVLKESAITEEILNCLLAKDKVAFGGKNVTICWRILEDYNEEFIEYLDRNLNDSNVKEILDGNVSICNRLINNTIVSDKLFNRVIAYAKDKIDNINAKLDEKRISSLIEKDLLAVNEENIEILLENSYNEELSMLANSGDEERENYVVTELLNHDISDELIYLLVNSNISYENAIKLVEKNKENILIEKINSDKEEVIENILKGDISNENIDFVCDNFEAFGLKDEFIESLDGKSRIEELDNKNLNDDFMQYVLKSSNINTSTKVNLIITKIKNKLEEKILEKYISYDDEIAELSSVWHGEQPELDNSDKERIGQALIDYGYVKKVESEESSSIVILKDTEVQ